MQLRFVTSRAGNLHMTELLEGLCHAAHAAGHDARVERDGFPVLEPDTVFVVIPHEFYACEPPARWPSRAQRDRTIVLFVENPYTVWFDQACGLCPHFASVLAINRASVGALRHRGVGARHLQLGYLPQWDLWGARNGERPIDITYLGAADPRRDAHLGAYGQWLWSRRTAMLVPVLAPKPEARSDYLLDRAKFSHLAGSKLLLNLHRGGSEGAFEWVRALQAMANGCVVVSEPSVDHGPLVAGEHFISASPRALPHVANRLLDDPARWSGLQQAAYAMLRDELPMARTIEPLLDGADALVSGRSAHALPAGEPTWPRPGPTPAVAPASDPATRVGVTVRALATDVMELRRAVDRLIDRTEGRGDEPELAEVLRTPAFAAARPAVTVAITLYDYEREVLSALAGVAASAFTDFEVLVLDDASRDGSLEAVRRFALAHPWLPLSLLRHRVNHGLGASRNALAGRARGELMFVLDADNEIFPTTLGRLVEALDGDPGASFAYPLLAVTEGRRAVGLLSHHGWDPSAFRHGNYIDAMAMLRLDDLLSAGGYTEDPRLTGWEDFHLWCRFAETGRRGHQVPEVLGRYRRAGHSMLGWTQSDATIAWSVMRARFPDLLEPATG